MASGLPVVSCRAVGVVDCLRDGENGLLVRARRRARPWPPRSRRVVADAAAAPPPRRRGAGGVPPRLLLGGGRRAQIMDVYAATARRHGPTPASTPRCRTTRLPLPRRAAPALSRRCPSPSPCRRTSTTPPSPAAARSPRSPRRAGRWWSAPLFTASVADPDRLRPRLPDSTRACRAEVDYMALRRAEDAEACAPPRAPARSGCPSAKRRTAATPIRRRAVRPRCARTTPRTRPRRARWNRLLARPAPDLLLAPQAIGGHVDHVQRRARPAPAAATGPARAVVADFPYLARGAHAPSATLRDARWPCCRSSAADPAMRRRKRHACAAYATQLGFQFGGPRGSRARWRRWGRWSASARRVAARPWSPPSVRPSPHDPLLCRPARGRGAPRRASARRTWPARRLRRQACANATGRPVPDADPADGGIGARCLLLLETPGPSIGRTGFVSRDNPTPTAGNLRRFLPGRPIARRRHR